jgi:hypothetical protein
MPAFNNVHAIMLPNRSYFAYTNRQKTSFFLKFLGNKLNNQIVILRSKGFMLLLLFLFKSGIIILLVFPQIEHKYQ